MTRQGFVDGVIDHFEHHVVQTGAIMDIADVHPGAFADGLQAAKDGDATGIIGRFRTRTFLFRHAIV
jgi:hypothetical protein